uniref:Transmembrane protein 135 n=1 Tax=Tanacetum cinerariifolium TaxID=118510 RepID=A0A699JBS3_TANCI|nr:transmembrane protein 135 [Tanacetum cinerariifolium]
MSPPVTTGNGGACEHNTDEELSKPCSQCDDNRKPKLTSSSSSYALLSFDSFPVEDYDKRWRIFTAAVKGFAIGAGLKGGFSLFAIVSRLRRRRSLSNAK